MSGLADGARRIVHSMSKREVQQKILLVLVAMVSNGSYASSTVSNHGQSMLLVTPQHANLFSQILLGVVGLIIYLVVK